MITKNTLAHSKRLILLGWFVYLFAACTYDYFEDETNFRLYVPQVKSKEIKSFYVAFHDVAGNNVRVRTIEAPFNKDSFMEQGVLRFKLYPGEYRITCFADYAEGSITQGVSLANSYKAKEPVLSEKNLYVSRSGDFTTDPRFLAFNQTIYPAGHPGGKDTVVSDISDIQRYKGEVIVKLLGLPAAVARVDVLYSGLATKLRFDGALDRFSPQDRIIASIDVSKYIQQEKPEGGGSDVVFADKINPSAGINLNDYRMNGSIGSAESLQLEVRFFDQDGGLLGVTRVSEEDLVRLAPDKRPIDNEGNSVTSLILEPQKGFVFTFKGFAIFQIALVGWKGDIGDGEITPM